MNRLLVPSELMMKNIKNSKIKSLEVWLRLKMSFSGTTYLTTELIKAISQDSSISVRTSKRHIQSLVVRNWIGFKKETNTIFIRSLDTVCRIEKIDNKSSYWLQEKDLKDLKKFALASHVSELIKWKLTESWQSNRKGRRIKPKRFSFSVSYLCLCTGLGRSTVKRLLKNNPYVKKYKCSTKYLVNGKPASVKNLNFIRVYGEVSYVRIKNDKVVYDVPNQYESKMTRKKRRSRLSKLDHIKKRDI